jgi:hypothetical protein
VCLSGTEPKNQKAKCKMKKTRPFLFDSATFCPLLFSLFVYFLLTKPDLTRVLFLFFVYSFGNTVGTMYVREYFEEAARQSMNEMVKIFRSVFSEIINEHEWMDN